MSIACKDHEGRTWHISWGVTDPVLVLKNEFSTSGPFEPDGSHATFTDPLYANETKTLGIYTSPEGHMIAMSEITPGIYAAGKLQSR